MSLEDLLTWCDDELWVDVDGDVCPVGVGGAEAVGDDALVPPRVVVLQVGEAQLGGDLATLPVEGVRHIVDTPVVDQRFIKLKLQLGSKTTENCNSPVPVVLWLTGAVLDDLRVELPLEAHLGGRGGGRAAEQRQVAPLLRINSSYKV